MLNLSPGLVLTGERTGACPSSVLGSRPSHCRERATGSQTAHSLWKSRHQARGPGVQSCSCCVSHSRLGNLSENLLLIIAMSCQSWHTAKETKTPKRCWVNHSSRLPSPISLERKAAKLSFSSAKWRDALCRACDLDSLGTRAHC